VNDLRDRIVRAAECVTDEILTNISREIEYRLELCRANNDDHSETY